MTTTLADLDRIRPVNPDALSAAVAELRERQRAWQLRELRSQAGMTQADMAEAMHVGQNRVSQIESGGAERSRLETLRRYAEALGGHLSVEIAVGDTRYIIA
ncbi:MAG: helix-turn-helix transcriptional regulator [Cellulomonadaceae bacterium]|jgi:DNA-binding XRE family transcriptional regulator|nr:helix-turn-helix transcriptional regulator [Cellulomonadaceae bacterium]